MKNLTDVINTYGPMVACNVDYGLYITVNGSYFNCWVYREDHPGFRHANDETGWINAECRPTDLGFNGLHGADMADVITRAEKWLAEIIETELEGNENENEK